MEHNWTEEDFNVGFQEEAGPENRSEAFLKYEALLKDELAKGEVRMLHVSKDANHSRR